MVSPLTSSSSLDGTLFVMGNPLLDIIADVQSDILEKYKLKANDAILAAAEHIPLYHEVVEKYPVQYIAGGSAQNTARCAQWLLPANSTVYIGCIGADEYGRKLEEAARGDGLSVHYLRDPMVPTGTCAVLLSEKGKNRSLVANLSAANMYQLDHLLTPEIDDLMQKAKYFYISGFFLTVCPAAIMHVARHAHENNKTFIMNLSAPFLSEFFKEPMNKALPYVDVLFGNESEALSYAKNNGIEETDIKAIALKLASLKKANESKPRLVIITQGSDPSIVVSNGKLIEFPVPLIASSEIVDTNGAGDCFVGGFLSRFIQGKELAECVRVGNYAAGEVIRRSGCTFPKEPKIQLN